MMDDGEAREDGDALCYRGGGRGTGVGRVPATGRRLGAASEIIRELLREVRRQLGPEALTARGAAWLDGAEWVPACVDSDEPGIQPGIAFWQPRTGPRRTATRSFTAGAAAGRRRRSGTTRISGRACGRARWRMRR